MPTLLQVCCSCLFGLTTEYRATFHITPEPLARQLVHRFKTCSAPEPSLWLVSSSVVRLAVLARQLVSHILCIASFYKE